MSDEQLTNSEVYVRKTNRIILIVGLTSLLIFLFGISLLLLSGGEVEETSMNFENTDDGINIDHKDALSTNIEIGSIIEGEVPLTMTPDPVPLGQVIIGSDARNVLTLGTNGHASIKIISVNLADPPADGFSFVNSCGGKILKGEETCHIQISWVPVVAGNIQNNFIITWVEVGLGDENAKAAKVPVIGSAIRKEDCNFCDSGTGGRDSEINKTEVVTRYAIGPSGEVIGTIDEDGYVRDKDNNVIGRVNNQGMVVDNEGNIVGVAENRKLVVDENGNVIGFANNDGSAVDK